MYEIKEMSPEPAMPKRPRPIPKKRPLSTRSYFNESRSTNDYIYQQTLKQKQTPHTWRLIPIDDIPTKKFTRRPKDLPPIVRSFHFTDCSLSQLFLACAIFPTVYIKILPAFHSWNLSHRMKTCFSSCK